MAREKWLVDPGELDEFQREVFQLDINDDYIIKGCAGSGKTILALYRAQEVHLQASIDGEYPSFTFVVFTKTLTSFIKSGILELGINVNQVIHWEKWDGSPVDYIIVDECQDFPKEKIQLFFESKNKSIMLYGDSEQQIYSNGISLEMIAKDFGVVQKELNKNYRLPKLIADFVSHLNNDSTFKDRCVKEGTEKPRIKKWPSWEEELDYIMTEIRTRNYTDVAILVPFNATNTAPPTNQSYRNVESIRTYFENNSFGHEAKINNGRGIDDLDFDSELPKVMTFHSAKGLQFETVFIPFCDYPGQETWLIDNVKKPLYVGLTRTFKNLYITHTGKLTRFFDKIPPFKYD